MRLRICVRDLKIALPEMEQLIQTLVARVALPQEWLRFGNRSSTETRSVSAAKFDLFPHSVRTLAGVTHPTTEVKA